MKINSKNIKKHARKIKDASEEEISKLQGEYKKLMGNINTMSSPMLLLISFIGVFIIIYFRSNFFDIIGLIILIYPFYLFVQKESHEEGFCEGYYDLMTKNKSGGGQEGKETPEKEAPKEVSDDKNDKNKKESKSND